ncbi:MAG: HAD hydrolase-like protein [bacterium]|nr:HAD hydrolase-like protein [bacterium]
MKTTPEIIAFDADDTLWHNETLFQLTTQKFTDLLADYHSPEWIQQKLFDTEIKNLKYFGYGIKGFTLSLIESAIELTEGRVSGSQIQKIIEYAREMVKAPVELLDHVRESIEALSKSYKLMIITKGDLLDQESKIARSGLSDYFETIEIVTRKDKGIYSDILKKCGVTPQQFMMVGNSFKSDVLPLIEIGAHAVFIPYHICWDHEKVDAMDSYKGTFTELKHVGLLEKMLKEKEVKKEVK